MAGRSVGEAEIEDRQQRGAVERGRTVEKWRGGSCRVVRARIDQHRLRARFLMCRQLRGPLGHEHERSSISRRRRVSVAASNAEHRDGGQGRKPVLGAQLSSDEIQPVPGNDGSRYAPADRRSAQLGEPLRDRNRTSASRLPDSSLAIAVDAIENKARASKSRRGPHWPDG